MWHIIGQKCPALWRYPEYLQHAILSQEGHYLVSWLDKKLALFSAATGEVKHATNIEGGFLSLLEQQNCILFQKNKQIYKYSLKTGKEQYLRDIKYLSTDLPCAPTGKYVIHHIEKETKLYCLDDAGKDHLLNGHEDKCSIRFFFSPNGEWFVSACNDKTVGIWSTKTGQMQTRFTKHRGFLGAVDYTGQYEHAVKWLLSGVDIPYCAAFSPDNILIASANGGFSSYTVFIYTRQGKQQQKFVEFSGASIILHMVFNFDGKQLAVLKIGFPFRSELHLWDWQKARCIQRVIIEDGLKALDYNKLVWHKNTIRIFSRETQKCLTFYKGKDESYYRLTNVLGIHSPNSTKLSLKGTRGLTTEQYQLLKAQGAQNNPRAFVRIVDDEKDTKSENSDLAFLKLCRKNLIYQRKQEYSCPALFEPQKYIYSDRWQVVIFRIMEGKIPANTNISDTTQVSTSQGINKYHVYGLIEGLDATGRHIMIRFDLVEDDKCKQYARVKNKCVLSESVNMQARRQAFMSFFKPAKGLPTKLCVRISGMLTGQERDKLLDTIIAEQQRQFESQEMWEELRIRYQQTGGRKANLVKDYYSANCLTWLCHILRPYKLSLPHSSVDNVAVNPKHTLSASSFFRKTSNKVCDVSDWNSRPGTKDRNLGFSGI